MSSHKDAGAPIQVTIPDVGSAFRVWDRQRRRTRWVYLPTHSQIEAQAVVPGEPQDADEDQDDWETLMALLWKQKKH